MAKEKSNPLQAALKAVPDIEPSSDSMPAVELPSSNTKAGRTRTDRAGTVMIGGHFPKSYKQQLRMIAAEEDTTSQALLEEALNLLFMKKGKGKIV